MLYWQGQPNNPTADCLVDLGDLVLVGRGGVAEGSFREHRLQCLG